MGWPATCYQCHSRSKFMTLRQPRNGSDLSVPGTASYSLATGLDAKTEKVQIGEEAREVFATFTWEEAEDNSKINKVLTKFEQYCQPRRNVPFERYRFNRRMQEPGESYDQYRTALRKSCVIG